MQKYLLLFTVLFFCISVFGQSKNIHLIMDNPENAREWKDVNYAGDTLTGHRLDIYLPPIGEGPFPVIVSIAGSAWFGNNTKKRAFKTVSTLLDSGFAIVAVNHRSSREAIFPAQLFDIKAAVRFVRANAEKYRLDTQFIGIAGNSSGGHLAALMGATKELKSFIVENITLDIEGGIGSHTDESSHINAVVDWYGPTDFVVMDSCGSKLVHDDIDSPESTLIGGLIQNNHNLCRLANPITFIDSDDPAFLILHGDEDKIVPHCQSVLLHQAIQKKGGQSELIIVPGGKHGEGMYVQEYMDLVHAFLKREYQKSIMR